MIFVYCRKMLQNICHSCRKRNRSIQHQFLFHLCLVLLNLLVLKWVNVYPMDKKYVLLKQ